jgi:hypothetical protein
MGPDEPMKKKRNIKITRTDGRKWEWEGPKGGRRTFPAMVGRQAAPAPGFTPEQWKKILAIAENAGEKAARRESLARNVKAFRAMTKALSGLYGILDKAALIPKPGDMVKAFGREIHAIKFIKELRRVLPQLSELLEKRGREIQRKPTRRKSKGLAVRFLAHVLTWTGRTESQTAEGIEELLGLDASTIRKILKQS